MAAPEERWRTQIDAKISDPRENTIIINWQKPLSLDDETIGMYEETNIHKEHKKRIEYFTQMVECADGSVLSQKITVETDESLYYRSTDVGEIPGETTVIPTITIMTSPDTLYQPSSEPEGFRITTTRIQ